ncbi:thioredoxin [Sulfolobus islandicus Y.G.57.14]|jgi:thioredoxin 1|uniref:Thioredoxin n=7 Tax=Saccharolobus islandicus TaxID=43080 RepID=M9UBH2_SACIS|nr:thioredoxin [Sulfolobus islandicus]ACP34204.1 thioredoxin [Sulfolobus islandicus L.S.2.15]ACP44344.1 thioredoxin [Sulfolobus islandicus Y.G.57.14]ACP54079.1 thioredoxin [Sulfolobus islandicus M.16.27]ACR40686.1 thioredoxin [Sulfolobus islandicus M.16.4]ADX81422.1 thioredoxin [Sulfolobus islandicus HVE10/4]
MNDELNDPELQKILSKKANQILNSLKEKVEEPVKHLNSKNFEEFITKNKIAVVDFWAEWCAPCFILAPIIEELANDYPQVAFGKLNTEENQDIVMRYGIMSLPTVMFFKNGEPVDQILGAVPREEIEVRIKALLE